MDTTLKAELQYLIERYGAKAVEEALLKVIRREMIREAAEKVQCDDIRKLFKKGGLNGYINGD